MIKMNKIFVLKRLGRIFFMLKSSSDFFILNDKTHPGGWLCRNLRPTKLYLKNPPVTKLPFHRLTRP